MGAKAVHTFNVARVGRRNDPQASLPGYRHGMGANIPSGTMNEHRLTRD